MNPDSCALVFDRMNMIYMMSKILFIMSILSKLAAFIRPAGSRSQAIFFERFAAITRLV